MEDLHVFIGRLKYNTKLYLMFVSIAKGKNFIKKNGCLFQSSNKLYKEEGKKSPLFNMFKPINGNIKDTFNI